MEQEFELTIKLKETLCEFFGEEHVHVLYSTKPSGMSEESFFLAYLFKLAASARELSDLLESQPDMRNLSIDMAATSFVCGKLFESMIEKYIPEQVESLEEAKYRAQEQRLYASKFAPKSGEN